MSALPSTADLRRSGRTDRVRGIADRLAITGITMIITGTSTSMCCSRLHRQRHRLQRQDRAAERQGARLCVGAAPGASCPKISALDGRLPAHVYPSPRSSTPTGFTLLTGSSNQFITVGVSMSPIAAVSIRPQRAVIGRSQRYHGRVAGWRRMTASGIVMSAIR
jgi:hypothetical protein